MAIAMTYFCLWRSFRTYCTKYTLIIKKPRL